MSSVISRRRYRSVVIGCAVQVLQAISLSLQALWLGLRRRREVRAVGLRVHRVRRTIVRGSRVRTGVLVRGVLPPWALFNVNVKCEWLCGATVFSSE